jgi:hypothetical protein
MGLIQQAPGNKQWLHNMIFVVPTAQPCTKSVAGANTTQYQFAVTSSSKSVAGL